MTEEEALFWELIRAIWPSLLVTFLLGVVIGFLGIYCLEVLGG